MVATQPREFRLLDLTLYLFLIRCTYCEKVDQGNLIGEETSNI